MGEWKAPLNFIIVPTKKFEVIMGLEWADKYMVTFFGERSRSTIIRTLWGKCHGGLYNTYKR